MAKTRYLVLLGDGMADFPLAELDGRTPLEVANTPAMDAMARNGVTGLFYPVPDGLAPGSDVGNLSVFGYDPRATYSGRAPLEAANQGIALGPGQVAFRCNLVTLRDGLMEDFTAGHISSEDAAMLISALAEGLRQFPVSFSAGVSYRHLTIITPPADGLDDVVALACTPPHDITGRPFASHLPQGAGADLVLELMEASRPILEAHAVNATRRTPATSIWLWGQGLPPTMSTYAERFGLTGAVISAVDLVKGIGVCAGLRVLDVPGATGYLDTNYAGKVEAAKAALDEGDFVYLHVEAPDEASHERNVNLKIRAIEDFDSQVVAPFLDLCEGNPDLRVLVCPDHVTSIDSGTHAGGPVPFLIFGAGVSSNGASAYSEAEGRKTGLMIEEGHVLTERWLASETIDGHSFDGPLNDVKNTLLVNN